MSKGTVKFFNDTKGFGFITPEDGSKDLFVHASNLASGVSTLRDNDQVEFEIVEGKRGLQADNVCYA